MVNGKSGSSAEFAGKLAGLTALPTLRSLDGGTATRSPDLVTKNCAPCVFGDREPPRETREKRRRRRTLSIERLHTETRIGPGKLQEKPSPVESTWKLLHKRGLRIHSSAFSSSTEPPLTHEFRGRRRKKRHHIQRNGADKQQHEASDHFTFWILQTSASSRPAAGCHSDSCAGHFGKRADGRRFLCQGGHHHGRHVEGCLRG